MKWLVIPLYLLISAPTMGMGDERQLLKCLGAEEKRFHLSKDLGPLYDLNQRLISEMLQIPKAEIHGDYFNEICGKGSFSPSWKLLELSISKGKEVFEIPESVTGNEKQMALRMVDDFLEATREIFLNLMTQIQAASPSPTCLKEEIPELDSFFNDIKYLQEDVDINKIFAGRDIKIFMKLKDYPQAFKRCQSRIKKKLKSESSPAAKKS